jgi:hypothetical protein
MNCCFSFPWFACCEPQLNLDDDKWSHLDLRENIEVIPYCKDSASLIALNEKATKMMVSLSWYDRADRNEWQQKALEVTLPALKLATKRRLKVVLVMEAIVRNKLTLAQLGRSANTDALPPILKNMKKDLIDCDETLRSLKIKIQNYTEQFICNRTKLLQLKSSQLELDDAFGSSLTSGDSTSCSLQSVIKENLLERVNCQQATMIACEKLTRLNARKDLSMNNLALLHEIEAKLNDVMDQSLSLKNSDTVDRYPQSRKIQDKIYVNASS